MKKSFAYLLLFSLFGIFVIVILLNGKKEIPYRVEMRTGLLAVTPEWRNSKQAIETLIKNVNNNPEDKRSVITLGMAYIQESRISGNHSYYDGAALQLFDNILKSDPGNLECLVGKATVFLSQHHFTDAIPVALKAKELYPHSSAVYGLLTDAYVETGQYDKAIESADQMSLTRPDMRSYSRISYLREIHGDYPGAINSMKAAVDAGYPGHEQTEWCRYQLGLLYEKTGKITEAINLYEECIYYRPSFAWAYAGIGRIEAAGKNYSMAIQKTKQALSILKEFSFQKQLTEFYRASNRQQEAAISARETIKMLAGNNGDESEKNHGHYADNELALAYLDAYDYTYALKHAMVEYNRRPANIEVNHTLALVYFKLGRYSEAENHIDYALRTNSKDALLNLHASLIKTKCNKPEDGSRYLSKAIEINPFLEYGNYEKQILSLK